MLCHMLPRIDHTEVVRVACTPDGGNLIIAELTVLMVPVPSAPLAQVQASVLLLPRLQLPPAPPLPLPWRRCVVLVECVADRAMPM